jgi:hypothetical protein
MSTQIKLTGWKAVAVIVVIAAVIGFRMLTQSRTLQTEAVAAVKTELAADYARQLLPELQEATQAPDADSDGIERMVGTISVDNIEIVSISARGRGDDVVVRVEIEVQGQDPPDGERTRYFEMRHSSLTGWSVRHEVGKWSYYLTL